MSQLVNQSRAVPRLNVPDYDWWSESLHGVARNGTTEFPEPVGLAAAAHLMARGLPVKVYEAGPRGRGKAARLGPCSRLHAVALLHRRRCSGTP